MAAHNYHYYEVLASVMDTAEVPCDSRVGGGGGGGYMLYYTLPQMILYDGIVEMLMFTTCTAANLPCAELLKPHEIRL
jgi:hypothetical protein